jgi:hypothetical protein
MRRERERIFAQAPELRQKAKRVQEEAERQAREEREQKLARKRKVA